MLLTQSDRHPGTCDVLEWDSTFFGRRMARFRPRRCTPHDVTKILTECTEVGIDCVYILLDVSDSESIAAVQAKGAYLADIRVTFRNEISPMVASPEPASRLRLAIGSDIPALRQIAAVSHRHTRFYTDKHFSSDECSRLYELWIEKSCQGYADAVLVMDDDIGEPAGYVTCHRDGEASGHIGLFAVRECARGRGVGQRLLGGAQGWFAANGVSSMTVATQLRNVGAVQFYSHAGLLFAAAEMWFHLWPRDVNA